MVWWKDRSVNRVEDGFQGVVDKKKKKVACHFSQQQMLISIKWSATGSHLMMCPEDSRSRKSEILALDR